MSASNPVLNKRRFSRSVVFLLAVLLLLLLVYIGLAQSGILLWLMDTAQLKQQIISLGYAGPLMIMSLMAIAIIINPIPSAPIALAAGAVFGHTWGTIYVVAGATTGAVIAFSIARLLGYEGLCRLLGRQLKPAWLGSQNILTMMVLISRFVPFISFDLVSYAAGLTPIKFWRFALATVFGLIPASFLLAHFGGELSIDHLNRSLLIITVLGGVTLLPVLVLYLRKQYVNKQAFIDD